MVREDLINSAVSFLQDPSVAQAPVEKKIAFLQSKNLTQEEVDASLARVGEPPASAAASSAPANYAYRQAPPPPPTGYGPYPGYWQQPPPPELPKRDWRDWFIMATVMGGVSYGIYFTAKRYIIPLIKPPTPPQLEQDKATIDESFEKSFALLDQLNTDTAALKASEENRTTRLDAALAELESVLASLKESDRKREDDARRNADEIRGLRDLIPKALEVQKETSDNRLKELGNELKSLKTLVGNRMSGSGASASGSLHRPTGSMGGNTLGYTPSSTAAAVQNGSAAGVSATNPSSTATGGPVGSSQTVSSEPASNIPVAAQTATTTTPDRSQSSTPFGSSRFGSGKAAIPAWQMGAAKKSQEALNGDKKDTSASGTAIDASAA